MFLSLFLSITNYQPLSMWQHSRFQTYAKNILCSMISSNSVAVGWTARSDAVVESTTFAQSVTVKTLQQQDPEPGSSVRINLALFLKDSISQIEQALQLLTNWHFIVPSLSMYAVHIWHAYIVPIQYHVYLFLIACLEHVKYKTCSIYSII